MNERPAFVAPANPQLMLASTLIICLGSAITALGLEFLAPKFDFLISQLTFGAVKACQLSLTAFACKAIERHIDYRRQSAPLAGRGIYRRICHHHGGEAIMLFERNLS
jgi:hypothetical protein